MDASFGDASAAKPCKALPCPKDSSCRTMEVPEGVADTGS